MAFQQGLSGLNVSAKAIDVISNNIANSATVGFKTSTAQFADVYAASLSGAGASNVGLGTSLATVAQQFTQGNLTTTNNPLDMAINGAGFFRMSQGGTVTYTRNGQFQTDQNGFLVNAGGARLTGYVAGTSGIIIPTSPQDIQIDSTDIAPVATGSSTGIAGFRGVRANLNLDARSTVPANAWAPSGANVITIDPTTYNFSTALSIFDSLGNPHTMSFYFVKTANSGEWEVRANVDGTREANVTGFPQLVTFDAFGAMTTPMPLAIGVNLAGVNADLAAAGLPVPVNSANTPLSFDVDLGSSTQFGSAFGTNRLEQDGFAPGRLVGISISQEGIVQGRYTNGQSRNLAQVALVNFTAPNGLQPLGGNQWAETADSGPPLIGAPGTSSLGLITSSAVEDSNVDLTAELVNMITAQRNYQANAQSIRTQDQILQTLVNLR
jgi:flagellar hook protein FlgE